MRHYSEILSHYCENVSLFGRNWLQFSVREKKKCYFEKYCHYFKILTYCFENISPFFSNDRIGNVLSQIRCILNKDTNSLHWIEGLYVRAAARRSKASSDRGRQGSWESGRRKLFLKLCFSCRVAFAPFGGYVHLGIVSKKHNMPSGAGG